LTEVQTIHGKLSPRPAFVSGDNAKVLKPNYTFSENNSADKNSNQQIDQNASRIVNGA
jgi:hypothetical protein